MPTPAMPVTGASAPDPTLNAEPDPDDAAREQADLIEKRSVVIAGHATSISLEAIFWRHLKALAARRRQSVAALVGEIDAGRGAANLSSAIRVHVLRAVANDPETPERKSGP